jgi:adenosylcobinamide-GDP ribazoletransferase
MSILPETWREELLAALTFLTRLPFHRLADEGSAPAELGAASWAFPLAGIVVGLCGGIAYGLAGELGLPLLAAAVIAIGATILSTGGLHEDGLADSADGLGGHDREGKLAIMRDSRIGAYGVLALVLSVVLRAAALEHIAGFWGVLGALMAAHALARGFLPAALRFLDPARDDGLGASAGRPASRAVLWSCGVAIAAAGLCAGVRPGLAATIAAALVMAGMAWFAERQIGGQTGDILGALEQGGEVAALLAISAWWP